MKGQHRTPKTDIDTEVFRNWNALDNPVCRILDDEDGDVYTCREPGVLRFRLISICPSEALRTTPYLLPALITNQPEFFSQSHNG